MIQDFDDAQIDQFLTSWFHSTTRGQSRDATDAHRRLLEAIQESPSVRSG